MPPRTAESAILADLNEAQRRAVLHRDGPLLVLAGPGSGKTRVITRRAAQLVHTGVAPHHLLAITFTNKAADEMRTRIEALGVGVGTGVSTARRMWVYTFHALGARLLREFGDRVGVSRDFTIYDEQDQQRVLKDAMQRAEVNPTFLSPDAALSRIRSAKDRLLLPEDLADEDGPVERRMAARVYAEYERLLRERNAADFDDLLMRVAMLLRDDTEVADRLNRRFAYVLIDEYQDTNHAQYLIARYLSQQHRNICATGDPDQSIYGWRGADLSNILEFERDYPDALVIRLEQNYRSTAYILRTASRLIQANQRRRHKDLWSEIGEGEPVRVRTFDDGLNEADCLAETITRCHANGARYSDFAVFYRVNALSRALEDALRLRDIPYRIARGQEFYARKEIRDTLAYLRVLVNPADDVALLRIINTPPRGIGKTTIHRLTDYARQRGIPLLETLRRAEQIQSTSRAWPRIRAFLALLDNLRDLLDGPSAAAVSAVLQRTGLEAHLRQTDATSNEDRLANAQELVSAAARYDEEHADPSVRDFLERVSLASDQDAVDESAGVVMLMTLHAAKGLEFPNVFIVGVEHGLIPHERTLHDQSRDRQGAVNTGDLMEEERRLLFVGITRAQRNLFISHARHRVVRGVRTARSASKFLYELPDDSTVREDFGAEQSAHKHDDKVSAPLDDEVDFDQISERGVGRRRRRRAVRADGSLEDEPVFSADEPTGSTPRADGTRSFRDWTPGTPVLHEQYGPGQVVWLRPAPGRTHASIRFAGIGERTMILEFAPVRRLERGPR